MVKRTKSRRIKTRRKTRRKAHRRSHRGHRGHRGHRSHRRKTRVRHRRRELDSRAAGLGDGHPWRFNRGFDPTFGPKGPKEGYGDAAQSYDKFTRQQERQGTRRVIRVGDNLMQEDPEHGYVYLGKAH